ncbi:ABC-three component system middle component 1 [Myroides odoratimimus]|uniref:ABC-three component system middle component 1 n=1 Tax=Myroides odoratimimus TaxID=76832 RepID=UPI0025783D45|nr:ABC-three component system middle component 1 [Myroides odoratimimus]MDM1328669.1 hypothetical protein [Myroides odoratimimus]
MPLNKANYIIESLKEKDENIVFECLECWIKEENNYNIYIFSIQLEDKKKLLEIHEELRDYIAIYFQSQFLEKNVERWNIYQFFFIKDKIDEVTKQLIEQDKFSTRKIIHDGLNREINDDDITSIIEEELFKFEYTPRGLATESIDEFLAKKEHNDVISILDKNIEIKELVKTLGHE